MGNENIAGKEQALAMYSVYAPWWPLVSGPEDYDEEAAFVHQVLQLHADGPVHSMLELGSGGGNNASYLKANYEMTLMDRSPAMLAVSRELNPECEHVEGDMRTARLERVFDAVFVHDAVMYMTTEEMLRQAITTAAVHCRPGGLVLFVPDYVRETFVEGTSSHGDDGEGRALRYLEWRYDPDPQDTWYITAFAYLFREEDRPLRADYEEHRMGLFARDTWLALMQEAGVPATVIRDTFGRDLFLGRKQPVGAAPG